MIRILKSKKGMTITEIIMALAILAIISIPLMAIFSNSIFITQLTKRQMEVNSIMQIAKGEVSNSVKDALIKIPDFEDQLNDSKKISLKPPADITTSPLYNTDSKFLALQGGNLKEAYKYSVMYVGAGITTGTDIANTVELIIKLYDKNGKFLCERKTEISFEL